MSLARRVTLLKVSVHSLHVKLSVSVLIQPYSHTAGLPPPTIIDRVASSFASFRQCSEDEVRKIVMSAPIKSCTLDPIPTFLLREFIDVLLPFITRLVNASLLQSWPPNSHKHAIVTPLLKKPGLDSADMNNYRPVSNLSFMSKLIERAVVNQLNEYIVFITI